jgi:hypothetical protein
MSSEAGVGAPLLEHARLIATAGRVTPADPPGVPVGDRAGETGTVVPIARPVDAGRRRAS